MVRHVPLLRAPRKAADVTNIFQAPGIFGSDTELARGPSETVSSVEAIPHQNVDRTGDRGPAPTRSRPCVVVLESAALPIPSPTATVDLSTNSGPTDRLDAELWVAARLPAPRTAAELGAVLSRHRPTAVLCKQSLDSIDAWFMSTCRTHGVDILVLAHPVYGLLGPVRLRRYGGLPWLRLRPSAGRSVDEIVKRGMDLALVLLTAPLSVPLMLLIMLAVSFGGRPLYLQKRVGAGGRPFRMVKFRTMRVDAERETGPAFAGANDARVTRTGRVLRRYRLDELPQLYNVLRGQMSLVGPRPERPEFVAELSRLPHYDLRHVIRPGLTGIAQLTGGYAATAEEKLRCDLLYLHCRSVRSDLVLLILTVAELFRGFPRG
jgi:lipopolysaccharide/colanic/teichoic acid biosynthesis glycosyltransferase